VESEDSRKETIQRERFRKKTHFFVTQFEIAVTIDEVIKSLLTSIYSRISLICGICPMKKRQAWEEL
jgi:hypothetical protein